jgi:hypothetical protein
VWEGHYGPSYLRDLLPEAAAELRRLHAVNAELLGALNNIEVSTHDAMTAALARAAIAKAEAQP